MHKSKPKPNISALARQYDVSRRTITNWRDTGTDLTKPTAVAKRAKQMEGRVSGAQDIHAARLEKIKLESERIRHALQVDRQTHVSASQTRAAGEHAGLLVKSTILKLQNDLPPMLAGRPATEIHRILKRYCREQLVALSAYHNPIFESITP